MARHLQDRTSMKYAGHRKERDIQPSAWRRILTSRSRLLILVIAVAGALLFIVSQTQTTVVGRCRADAGPGIDWSECHKRMLMLEGSNLEAGNLAGTDLSRTDLSRSNLTRADLRKAVLLRTSLAKANAQGANFDKVEGYRGEMQGLNGQGASFVNAELQRSNFAGAQLQNANFTKAELGRANFNEAALGPTAFVTANLSRANFGGAKIEGPLDFTNAFLFLTRIEGADLSQAIGLSQEQLDLSCGDDRTVLPQGLTRPLNWPCPSD
ncbi:pentapeptide repeat-containing protein [Rhizobium sp. SSA_523]|uniref:pentapeptide repeat-containing protein n=1 Tax=Rhizobium sp. SSA_523 TaxID=2952477 RepID=UPI002091962A|nr:pentapeptide repeat-containing protein [Rhizobium sp. SSA_523]MCO5730871.1 pentapeptide repeat-containing protein [Rhizobium sp. SSA_523]WKC24312.1 pentapeptide repeat-containing protein [Rhizobium sp. SSA_523]